MPTPPPARAAGALSKTEQALAQHIANHNPEALKLLERVVNINSGTMNFEGVKAVGKELQPEFDRLGFRTRWVDGAPFERAGHLIAERPATAGGADPLRVLLIGHLDTVFEPHSPFQRYRLLPGDRASGPGVSDMKGGVVVMLQALAALRAAGTLERMAVTVVLHGDEELSGRPLALARADLIAAGAQSDVAIGFEDGDGRFETAVVARRGSTDWTLRVTGKATHSSQLWQEEVGDGAIYELARILDEFRRELGHEQYLTFNPGVVLGGTTVEHDAEQSRGSAFGKTNVIAATAVVRGDLRTISPEQLQRTRERMAAIAAANLPHTSAEIEFGDGYPPMAPTAGNLALLEMFDRASRDLGHGPVAGVDPRQAGAADIAFIANAVKMALDGVGLMGTGGHTVEEIADLSTLPKQAQRVAVLLQRLSAEPRSAAP